MMLRCLRLHRAVLTLSSFIVVAVLGCADATGGDSNVHGAPTGLGDGRANTIQVTPPSAEIEEGSDARLKCLALDSRDVVVSTSPAWTSSDPEVATVGTDGKVTAVRPGYAVASCDVDGKTALATITVTESPVAFVEVTPGAGVLAVGKSIQLIGIPRDSTGAVVPNHQVRWVSPDSAVASVSSSGSVIARIAGTASVMASSGGKASFAKINVGNQPPVPVASISVRIDDASLNAGQLAHATATTFDANGKELNGRSITWSVQDPSVISAVATAGEKANVTGRSTGSTVLTATSEGQTASIPVTVAMAPVQTVTVSLASSNILPGQTTQATTTLKDASGNVLTGRSVVYSSLNTSIATVTPNGVVTGVTSGAVIIRATSENQTGDASLTVGVSSVATVSVTLGTSSLTLNQTTQATAVSRDASGAVLSNRSVAWSSSNTSVATVSIAGVVTAVGAGTANIVATVESKTGSASATVNSTSTSSATTASIQFTTNISSQLTVGSTAQISAAAYDATGHVITGKTITYASSAPAVATMSSTGLLTGVAAGGTVISASVDGKTISCQISVVAGTTSPTPTAAKVARVNVALTRNTLTVGDSTQASATVYDSTGATITGASVSWSVPASSATVAAVDGNGKVKSMASGSASVVATVSGVVGSAGLTISSTTTTAPPATGSTAEILAFAAPTIPVASVPTNLSFYETRFKAYADTQWAAFGPAWNAGNSISAYERGATYYVWWARTGDPTYRDRAHQLVVNYRDNYLVPNNYGTSPHWSQAESLYLDCTIGGDPASCTAVGKVANVMSAFTYGYLTNVGNPDLDHRIQARVIMALWMAEKLAGKGSVYTAQLDAAITQSLSTLNADGYANLTGTCGGSLNYMGGLLYDVLTRIHDQRPGTYNTTIETKAKAFGTFLWSSQWRGTANPADKSFNYLSIGCYTSTPGNPNGAGGPTSAPDLNGLIIPLFGWLGKTTGDPVWFTRGDQILDGTQSASVYLYRQFSETYSSSFRYLGYRFGQ